MGTVSQLSRPVSPPRRILEAVGNVTSEMQSGDRRGAEIVETGSRRSLIRSTRSVIEHYRQILADQQMSEADGKAGNARGAGDPGAKPYASSLGMDFEQTGRDARLSSSTRMVGAEILRQIDPLTGRAAEPIANKLDVAVGTVRKATRALTDHNYFRKVKVGRNVEYMPVMGARVPEALV